MRRAAISLLVTLALAGCKKGDGLVVLTVTASPPLSGLTSLHVTATAGGRSVTFDDAHTTAFALPPSRTLGIDFPPSVAGTMQLSVEARTGSAIVAIGSARIATAAGTTSDVTITLGTGTPDLGIGNDMGSGDMTGIGQGSTDMAGCGFITACTNGDNCCPAGCNQTNDSDCPSVCGNKVVEAGEICDDGNTVNGDSCDPTCQFTNTVAIVAGTADGFGRADGIGNTARLGGPTGYSEFVAQGITTDQQSLFFGDSCAVKKLNPVTKQVTTIAGAVGQCTAAVDDVGTAARFTNVTDLEWVPNGGKGLLFITGDNTLRKLDLGTMMVSSVLGVQGTATGGGDGIGSDGGGTTLYLVDNVNGFRSVNISSGAQTTIATFTQLGNICTDVVPYGGSFYLTCGQGLVTKVTPGAPNPTVVQNFAGGGTGGNCKASTGTNLATAVFRGANHLTVDSSGNLYVTDSGCNVVWWIITNGAGASVSVLAGSPTFVAGHDDTNQGTTHGTFNGPVGIAAINSNYYVVDTGNHMVRGFDSFNIKSYAGVYGNDGSLKNVVGATPVIDHPFVITASGDTAVFATFTLGLSNDQTDKLDVKAGSDTLFNSGIVFGVILGNALYGVATSATDHTLWKFPLDGTAPSSFAGMAHTGAMNPADGSLTTGVIGSPNGAIATDGTNLYFGDGSSGATELRMIDMVNKKIVTLAGALGTTDLVDDTGPKAHMVEIGGVTSDGKNVYFTDGLDNNSTGTVVRQLALATNAVSTLAGKAGTIGAVDAVGTAARFSGIKTMTTDGKALYMTEPGGGAFVGSNSLGDLNGPVIRELVLSDNSVSTMAGSRGVWTSRPGVGVNAAFNSPFGITFDNASHVLLVADTVEDVIYSIK